MSNSGESKSDGGVHVGAGDVADGVDHHRYDEATCHRRAQLRHFTRIIRADRARSTCRKHQQISGYHLRQHLQRDFFL